MRILITGSTGFLGRPVALRLAAEGHEVIALVRTSAMAPSAPGIHALDMDLASPDVSRLPDVDALMLLAQSRLHRDFPGAARDTFAVNVAAPFALMDWALGAGVRRIVMASSGGVYQRHGPMPDGEARVPAKGPMGFYLATKASAELLFESYAAAFATAVLVRPYFIFGPGQRSDMLIPRLIASVMAGRPIQLQGQHGVRMNPIYIEDAAAALVRAVALEGRRAIDIAGRDVVSIEDIAVAIGRRVGREPVFEPQPPAPSNYVADTSNMRATLGEAMTSFEDGLFRTIAAMSRP